MKQIILALSLIAIGSYAGTSAYNTAERDAVIAAQTGSSYTITERDTVIEMATDQVAMQVKEATFASVSTETDLIFTNASASTMSGALSTVTTNGIITLGRAGTFMLTMDGSFHASGATDFELQVHLDTGGGYADTGFGLVRTIANNSDASFSSSFHGMRAVGDKIKVVIVSGTERDITFNAVTVMCSWMD